ncbi:helix-turn-helix transcriptional regulator [Hymenobacter sp. ASUV-10]|uniref:Helix-turn-helix transcriptional regulator n=1 Tax=Hymenobacter aranciens TaxID=3063996 RepID=A0ABT9B782_9BACT|nr:helix-turn-helix transcriptional regulator [Hymenobacter sp. ASUV-10]MDO7874147.1 helix-turn-helix transcriptional regulator [Hymenobacter sp. ASUV-10]
MNLLVFGQQGEAVDLRAEAPTAAPLLTPALLQALCQQCPLPLVAVADLADGQPPQCFGTALAAVPALAPGPFDAAALHAALHPADAPLLACARAWASQFVQQHPAIDPATQLCCRLRLLGPGCAAWPVLHCVPLATLRTPDGTGPWVSYFQRLDLGWSDTGFRFGFAAAGFWPWLRRLLKATKQLYLTPREDQVLRLLLEGFSNARIAARLHIEHSTVLTHHRNLLGKAPGGQLPALAWLLEA